MLPIDKAQAQDHDVHNLEKKVELSKHQVQWYKLAQGLVTIFTDHIKQEHESNGQVHMEFYTLAELQEWSLKVSLLYK